MAEPCIDIQGPCRRTLELMPEETAGIMYAMFAIAVAVAALGFWMKIDAWRRGRPEPVKDHVGARVKRFVSIAVLQARTAKKRYAGPMHQLIYWGFLVLFAGTLLVLIEYDFTLPLFGYQFLKGPFYLLFEFTLDLFGILFLIGLGMAIRRRATDTGGILLIKPSDVWILGSLLLLGIQGFLVEGLRLALEQPAWAGWSFAGNLIAKALSGFDDGVLLSIYRGAWWFHALTLFLWISLLPYTKMQHILVSPTNVYLSQHGVALHKGELSTPFDLKKALEGAEVDLRMGAQKLEDFTWRQLLSLDACTECGRCTEVCPAYAAGRPLSPMKVVLDLRDEMHRQTSARWNGMVTTNGSDLRSPPPTNGSVAGNQIVDQVINNQTLWSCVTCRACMNACPVMIEHVPLILDLRRGLVMESRLDANQARLLNNLSNSGNAYGFPASDRDAWTEGLDVPKMADVGSAENLEVLYWVGCSGSFDSRNQKVSRSVVRLLQEASVKFAILGKEEKCNGDPARRLGEEGRFQELVISNVETLKKYGVRKVLAQCPHCFNTLKNEYRRFGVELDVVHHTQFLDELVKAGRLKPSAALSGSTTYHDPCYLGRYNDEYTSARKVLVQLQKDPIVEMPRHKEHSFCCGAGGSNMWFEVKEEKKRMSHIRIEEARATGAKRLATGCPFCMTMFDDAARMSGDDGFEVKDVAELMAEQLPPRA